MKTTVYITLLFLVSSVMSAFGQLSVDSNGKVHIGNGNDINFKGSGTDPGDIVFWDQYDNEMCRFYVLGDELHIRGNFGGYGGIMMDIDNENIGLHTLPDNNYEVYLLGAAYATVGW